MEYLEQSRALGNKLIVGLNSDASVRRLKGPDRPINNQEDRKAVLLALRSVSAVYIFEEDTPYELIKRLKVDLITKGGDYLPHQIVGNDIAEVAILPYLEGKSTTRTIYAINGNREKRLG